MLGSGSTKPEQGLGEDGANSNLRLKLPKQINLNALDEYGIKKTIPFSVSVTANSLKGDIVEKSDCYYIYAPNSGFGNSNSEIRAIVTLKTSLKNISNISTKNITGKNLNLVSIGTKSLLTGAQKYSTIIDNVNLKIKPENFNERIDVSNTPISQKVYSINGYYGLIQNENKLVLKDGNKTLFCKFSKLTSTTL